MKTVKFFIISMILGLVMLVACGLLGDYERGAHFHATFSSVLGIVGLYITVISIVILRVLTMIQDGEAKENKWILISWLVFLLCFIVIFTIHLIAGISSDWFGVLICIPMVTFISFLIAAIINHVKKTGK